MWAGLPTLVAFLAVSVVAWAPVLFVWGPGSYLRSLAMAQETHLRQAYWSLGAILDPIVPGGMGVRLLETARYFAAGAVAILGGRRVRSIDGVIIVGTGVFLIAQFGGYFGSYVYLAALAPVLCWRVDDWVARALPELSRAYAELPDAARHLRRPVVAATAPSFAAGRLLRPTAPPKTRSGRPTRTPAG
jgi:hypothetical protein